MFVTHFVGLIGKWHLGLHCKSRDNCHHPLNMGFHEFYGLPFTNTRDCGPIAEGSSFLILLQNTTYPVIIGCVVLGLGMLFTGVISTKYTIVLMCFSVLSLLVVPFALQSVISRMCCLTMRGFEVVEQPTNLENLTVRFTNDAKRFIRKNKKQPFLLFMSYAKVHAVLFTSPKFKGHSAHGRYGDNVEEMDWSVGEIVSALEEENLMENTLVYFTSDHGPFLEIVKHSTGERLGGSNGGYKGGELVRICRYYFILFTFYVEINKPIYLMAFMSLVLVSPCNIRILYTGACECAERRKCAEIKESLWSMLHMYNIHAEI